MVPGDGDVRGEADRALKALISEYERAGNAGKAGELERKRAVANALDVVIVMSWDTGATDVDLHLVEPHHHVSYQSKRSFQGGTLDRDVTAGYGPETYTLRHGAPGEYVVKVHYFNGGVPTKVAGIGGHNTDLGYRGQATSWFMPRSNDPPREPCHTMFQFSHPTSSHFSFRLGG